MGVVPALSLMERPTRPAGAGPWTELLTSTYSFIRLRSVTWWGNREHVQTVEQPHGVSAARSQPAQALPSAPFTPLPFRVP